VPEMITSDCGPQFTFSLWLQLCKMLNISHKQKTAYLRYHRCGTCPVNRHSHRGWTSDLYSS
jgi:hypothetical protein